MKPRSNVTMPAQYIASLPADSGRTIATVRALGDGRPQLKPRMRAEQVSTHPVPRAASVVARGSGQPVREVLADEVVAVARGRDVDEGRAGFDVLRRDVDEGRIGRPGA